MKCLMLLWILLIGVPFTQGVEVLVNLNVEKKVGGFSQFDRSKFITIHSSHTDNEWRSDYRGEENFTPDLLNDFFNGNDVYFGRDTGYLTWYTRNTIAENPRKAGWGKVTGANSINSNGHLARSLYDSDISVHSYESRASSDIVCAQFRPFWPGSDALVGGGSSWFLSNVDTPDESYGSATGNLMGHFMNEFYGTSSQVGRPLPAYVEVINEPDWPLFDFTSDPLHGTANNGELWDYHNADADEIRSVNSEVKVGGYTTAFPDFEKGDFQEWNNGWKEFIDVCGSNMDFYSLHFYDFNNLGITRRGSNIEATLDMVEHYSTLVTGDTKPFVISEFGGRDHDEEAKAWSPWRDWLIIRSINSMIMSFADRPDQVDKVIPFIICKAEWGRAANGNPYPWRLMRQVNEPASNTGEWVYTELVKFYELWADISGTKVDVLTSDPDLQMDAYVDGDKAYVILHNLTTTTQTINLNTVENFGNILTSVREKRLYWNGAKVVLLDRIHAGGLEAMTLASEATVVLEYDFENVIEIVDESVIHKYYATNYLEEIEAAQMELFTIEGVTPSQFGEGILRLGMGRSQSQSKQPTVIFNGHKLNVSADFMGHEGDGRTSFFGLLEIPVPHRLIEASNDVEISFESAGGYVTSLCLESTSFTSDVRRSGEFRLTEEPLNQFIFKLNIQGGLPLERVEVLWSPDLGLPLEQWTVVRDVLQLNITGEASVVRPFLGERGFYVARGVR